MVQKMMELEKQKRSMQEEKTGTKQGTIWRSATTNQPIQGYSKAVLESAKTTKPPKDFSKDLKNPFVSGIQPPQAKNDGGAASNLQSAL